MHTTNLEGLKAEITSSLLLRQLLTEDRLVPKESEKLLLNQILKIRLQTYNIGNEIECVPHPLELLHIHMLNF